MDPCTVETGLLRKKPCGQPGVTQCLNCERPLCSAHSVAQMAETGRKTGKFLCKECHVAWKEADKNAPRPMDKASMTAAKPAAAAPKPAAPPKAAPVAPAAAKAGAAKPAAAKPETPKPADDAPLEFTPSKPPAEKK